MTDEPNEPDYEAIQADRDEERGEKYLHRMDKEFGRVENYRTDPDEHPGPTVVTEPGVYALTDAEYFADPVPGGSLSNSGAKLLLPPNCPAKYAYDRLHGRANKKAFDVGHAVHALVLGSDHEITIVQADDWRTTKAKQAKAEAYLAGRTPLLAKEFAPIQAMAEAVLADPRAAALFEDGSGQREASMFWIDKTSGIWRRAKVDSLPDKSDGRMILVDLKTAESADPEQFAKAVASYKYHMQAACYSDGALALELAEDVAFLFVIVEKSPPYLVNVIGLELAAMNIGRIKNREACAIFAECQRTGNWYGYGDGIEYVSVPRWEEAQYTMEELSA